MLKALGLIILGLIVLAVIAALASKKGRTENAKAGYQYKSKALLTANEREMYWKLIDALPGYVVLAQVALSSCIDVKKTGRRVQHDQCEKPGFRHLQWIAGRPCGH